MSTHITLSCGDLMDKVDEWIDNNENIMSIHFFSSDECQRIKAYAISRANLQRLTYINTCCFGRGLCFRRRSNTEIGLQNEIIYPPEPLEKIHHPFGEHHTEKITCSICLSESTDNIRLFCSHSYCSPCIIRWYNIKQTCPICRCWF